MIWAAQELALRTDSVKCYIDKTSDSPLRWLCEKRAVSVWDLVSGCSNLTQKEYKKHHDKGA